MVCVGVRDGVVGGAEWEETAPGEGIVGWAEQFALLEEAGFDGPLVLDGLPAPPAKSGWPRRRRSCG